jgi:hypothetical protein
MLGIYSYINIRVFRKLSLNSKDNIKEEDLVARVNINNKEYYLQRIFKVESYLRRVLKTFATNYKIDIKVVYSFLCYLNYFRL